MEVYRQANLNGCSIGEGEIACQPDPPHRFYGAQRGANLTAVGATRSAARGEEAFTAIGDGRRVMESDDGPETVMVTSGDHMEHRFNGIRRDANLTALGATRSVAKGEDGRGVLDSNWSSFRSVSGGGNDLEQQQEHCFDGARRQVNLAPSRATWSLARSTAMHDGDCQMVSEAAGQGDVHFDHLGEQRFGGKCSTTASVEAPITRAVPRTQ